MAVLLCFAGCKDSLKNAFKVEDPQLKPIETMVQQNVPLGSTQGSVLEFLSARGYPTDNPTEPDTIVGIIRHIDTEKMQPVTARVTFYFDKNGKLKSIDVVRTMNAPIPK
ncbi:MAG TPA: hypothetical protein VMU53_04050 [Candidatus Sulfotelmatobacter sp.]|nr:hypothetical protein [Candidatus Sulfotelmatobacter sp.]